MFSRDWCFLEHSPKLVSSKQMRANDVIKTKQIAKLHIHVERAKGRAQNVTILNCVFLVSTANLLSDIVQARLLGAVRDGSPSTALAKSGISSLSSR